MAFLKTIAQKLWKHFGQELTHKTLVFPNKRSGIYFSNYIEKEIHENFVMPSSITINQLFEKKSKKIIADRLTLCSILYECFIKEIQTTESFSGFYNLGNTLLADFDTIDKNLISEKALFQNIDALKQMDFDLSYLSKEQIQAIERFWGTFEKKNLSTQQHSFLQLWTKLYNIYIQFNQHLDNDGICYEGKLYKDIITQLPKNGKALFTSSYIFIGFNALGKAEEELFSYLHKQNQAIFLWDYDKYFTEDENNEAGYFMRKLLPKFPPFFNDISQDNSNNKKKNIRHISCNGEIQQTKILGQLLEKEITNKKPLNDTAIVLANENLILPTLKSIPPNINKINTSIGYPFQTTTWAHLLSQLTLLQKTKTQLDNIVHFPTNTVLEILKNPFCNKTNALEAEKLIENILTNNLRKIALTKLSKHFSLFFADINNQTQLTTYIKNIITTLLIPEKGNSIEQYALTESLKKLQHLNNIFTQKKVTDIFFFLEVFQKELQQLHIPFSGQSTDGLQIIGFLETRLIDFKNLYILSANEDYLPQIHQSGSLIPYNLRMGYGLPTLKEQAAMYAYYFYRLIARASTVTLFSVACSQGTSVKEVSRYVAQLKFESPFNLQSYTSSTKLHLTNKIPPASINPEELKIIFNRYFSGEKLLSPSAINMYLRCPQSFYYRHIKGIKPLESIANADDNNMFGSIFHKAAELLYKPYIQKEINKDTLHKIATNIDTVLLQAFQEELFAGEQQTLQGKELLTFDILKEYIKRLVAYDTLQVPFTILELEKKYKAPISISIDGKQHQLVLYGFIDRVDKKNGEVRLIDYKTGNVTLSFEDIEALFDLQAKKNNSMVQQMLIYSWLFYQEKGIIGQPHVYAMKEFYNLKTSSQLYMHREPLVYTQQLLAEHKTHLQELLSIIFNANSPQFFPNEEKCSHDKYTGICTIF